MLISNPALRLPCLQRLDLQGLQARAQNVKIVSGHGLAAETPSLSAAANEVDDLKPVPIRQERLAKL